MAGSDVKAKRITGTGSLAVRSARIRQIQLKTASGTLPRLTVTNASGGATVLDLDFNASDTHSVNIPAEGIKVSDIFVSTVGITAADTFTLIRKNMTRKRDKQPPRTKKYYRSTKSGAGMTAAGVAKYRRDNPGSKLKTAVTGKVKKGFSSRKKKKIILCKKCRPNEEVSESGKKSLTAD